MFNAVVTLLLECSLLLKLSCSMMLKLNQFNAQCYFNSIKSAQCCCYSIIRVLELCWNLIIRVSTAVVYYSAQCCVTQLFECFILLQHKYQTVYYSGSSIIRITSAVVLTRQGTLVQTLSILASLKLIKHRNLDAICFFAKFRRNISMKS